jgi:hypothetical protein
MGQQLRKRWQCPVWRLDVVAQYDPSNTNTYRVPANANWAQLKCTRSLRLRHDAAGLGVAPVSLHGRKVCPSPRIPDCAVVIDLRESVRGSRTISSGPTDCHKPYVFSKRSDSVVALTLCRAGCHRNAKAPVSMGASCLIRRVCGASLAKNCGIRLTL